MGQDEIAEFYLCPRCLSPAERAGPCAECGTELIQCCPGAPDDPCRRPLVDLKGKLQTRAPLWWLRYSVTQLTDHLEEDK